MTVIMTVTFIMTKIMTVNPSLAASLEFLASQFNKDLISALKILFVKDTRTAKHVNKKWILSTLYASEAHYTFYWHIKSLKFFQQVTYITQTISFIFWIYIQRSSLKLMSVIFHFLTKQALKYIWKMLFI